MLIVAVILFVSCVYISLSDVRFRKINNKSVIVVALCCIFLGVQQLTFIDIGYLLLLWIVLLFLFAKRIIGGGDVKLIAAFSLALPTEQLTLALLLTAMIGGLVSLIYVLIDLSTRRKFFNRERMISINKTAQGIPYGVAICSGFYFVILITLSTGGSS
ncbi:A24 family peptidase [Vibrio agarivorans]|uniref:A24 family peptidase n=1 Tax=Vibrio agarivorans TaxID=153622 RepID=UPI00344FAEC9